MVTSPQWLPFLHFSCELFNYCYMYTMNCIYRYLPFNLECKKWKKICSTYIYLTLTWQPNFSIDAINFLTPHMLCISVSIVKMQVKECLIKMANEIFWNYVFILQKHFLVGIKLKTEICIIIYIFQVGGNWMWRKLRSK